MKLVRNVLSEIRFLRYAVGVTSLRRHNSNIIRNRTAILGPVVTICATYIRQPSTCSSGTLVCRVRLPQQINKSYFPTTLASLINADCNRRAISYALVVRFKSFFQRLSISEVNKKTLWGTTGWATFEVRKSCTLETNINPLTLTTYKDVAQWAL
jgi:hypothetical protein